MSGDPGTSGWTARAVFLAVGVGLLAAGLLLFASAPQQERVTAASAEPAMIGMSSPGKSYSESSSRTSISTSSSSSSSSTWSTLLRNTTMAGMPT